MITTENLTFSFGGTVLFEEVNVKFIQGNCYGLIGANGAGKSTFLTLLSGKIEPTAGKVHLEARKRIAVLNQDQFVEALRSNRISELYVYKHKPAETNWSTEP